MFRINSGRSHAYNTQICQFCVKHYFVHFQDNSCPCWNSCSDPGALRKPTVTRSKCIFCNICMIVKSSSSNSSWLKQLLPNHQNAIRCICSTTKQNCQRCKLKKLSMSYELPQKLNFGIDPKCNLPYACFGTLSIFECVHKIWFCLGCLAHRDAEISGLFRNRIKELLRTSNH